MRTRGLSHAVTPTAAYDNNTNTAAVVSGGYWNYGVVPMPVGGDYYFTSGQGSMQIPRTSRRSPPPLLPRSMLWLRSSSVEPPQRRHRHRTSNGWTASIQSTSAERGPPSHRRPELTLRQRRLLTRCAIPAGTNLSTVTVVVEVQTGQRSSRHDAAQCLPMHSSVSVAEIYIQ